MPIQPLVADAGPTQLLCNAQCDHAIVNCMGDHLCEVVCNGSDCTNLTLNCDPNGPCQLTCHNGDCQGAMVHCGRNNCSIVCDGSSPKPPGLTPGGLRCEASPINCN
jgi:hypothetical protein